jgi:hypothetical protein
MEALSGSEWQSKTYIYVLNLDRLHHSLELFVLSLHRIHLRKKGKQN